MPGITLPIAKAQLATWIAASESVASGQSFTTDTGRSLTRANLRDIQAQIDYWNDWCLKLDPSGQRRQRRVIVVND
jgi:hypothetical protein